MAYGRPVVDRQLRRPTVDVERTHGCVIFIRAGCAQDGGFVVQKNLYKGNDRRLGVVVCGVSHTKLNSLYTAMFQIRRIAYIVLDG